MADSTFFIYTKGPRGGSWSRYTFPFVITDFALLGNKLYFRHDDVISVFDDTVAYDELTPGGEQVAFAGRIQWNWTDNGAPGPSKHLLGFELVATGDPYVSIGYDQRDPTCYTTPYQVSPDTLPGGMIPFEVVAPTFSFRVDFAPGTRWSLSSAMLYVNELGGQP